MKIFLFLASNLCINQVFVDPVVFHACMLCLNTANQTISDSFCKQRRLVLTDSLQSKSINDINASV